MENGYKTSDKESIKLNMDLFDEYYKDTCAITKSDMISFCRKTLYIL